MRERLLFLVAGAACALGGVAASGSIAGAQRSAASDAKIVRELRAIRTTIPTAIGTLRGGREGRSVEDPDLETLARHLVEIARSTEKMCRDTAAATGGLQGGC